MVTLDVDVLDNDIVDEIDDIEDDDEDELDVDEVIHIHLENIFMREVDEYE